ncbi:acyl-CoA dehydrogenase family protein [Kibdelosporangium aridum]|uniref:Acyl-CoA dehydrogenase, C-terminal domain n=1 Tax=Kibdelosporangium aridum TaxID=2030 RepID=A0A1W2G083_KIBAR|nr:acyl-CoA dehydrogenase family protein [Kibdelosporangium aridum]SMD27595.1 Acyl-CoA dehydrogenase, C-terminal domain [Kibdelosporangium aridum]
MEPSGLAGWTWGILDLDTVVIHPEQRLIGEGMSILRDHFAFYRPLVTATALGGAAAVFDTVTATVTRRKTSGDIQRHRDSTLVTLGRAHAQLITSLLGTLTAARLAEAKSPNAETWSCAMKAHGVTTAHAVVSDLALFLGAAAFRADSPVGKTLKDLGGLLYADGIHDSLYRTAGKHHTAPPVALPRSRTNEESGDATAVVT